MRVSCSKQAAVATHLHTGKNNHAVYAFSDRAQPSTNLNTSTQPRQGQTSHVFAIVTSAHQITRAATHPFSSMPFLYRDDAALSFTNHAASSVKLAEPYADQLNRISTLVDLNRNPPVEAEVTAGRRAELSKEVLRT